MVKLTIFVTVKDKFTLPSPSTQNKRDIRLNCRSPLEMFHRRVEIEKQVLNGYLIFGMARVNLDLVDQVFNHRGVEIFQKEIEQLSCFFYI